MAMVFKGDPIISKVVSKEDGKEESQFCSCILFLLSVWYYLPKCGNSEIHSHDALLAKIS